MVKQSLAMQKPPPGNVSLADNKLQRAERIIRDYLPNLAPFIALYKDIHQHPELSTLESRTAGVVAQHLEDFGLDVKTSVGGHGVVGILANGPGKTILLRSELDALPIEEATGLPYASKVRMKDYVGREMPVMHACGHDVHMTCLLACVKLLSSAKAAWSGTIIAVFQPNEERSGGAQAMIDNGLYDFCPVPDLMLAQHLGGRVIAGHLALKKGVYLPASDYIEVDILSHGLGPNLVVRRDPVGLASYILTRFQSIISTDVGNTSEFATMECHDFRAGDPSETLTNRVHMRLEVKTTTDQMRDRIFHAVEAITKAECEASGGRVEASVRRTSRAPATRNDTYLTGILQGYFARHFGDYFSETAMDTAVEDFPRLSGPEPVPYVYWKLGCVDPQKWEDAERKGGNILEHLPSNHSPGFAPAPELTIATGTEAMALAALVLL